MPMTFLQAKQDVARSVGGSALSAQLTIAGQAIQDAIREFDTRHDFEYKLRTAADITVVSGTSEYAITGATNPKKVYTARLKTNKRGLYYVRQREVDRVVRDQESNEIPTGYTTVPDTTTVGNFKIKLLPTPSIGDLLQVRYYEHILVPSVDGTNLDVPDRYLPAVLALARYNFIIDRDSEDARAQTFLSKAEQRIEQAIRDDVGISDEDIRIVPSDEWAYSFGPSPWDWEY